MYVNTAILIMAWIRKEERTNASWNQKLIVRPSQNNWNSYKKLIRRKGLKILQGMRKKLHAKQIISRQYEKYHMGNKNKNRVKINFNSFKTNITSSEINQSFKKLNVVSILDKDITLYQLMLIKQDRVLVN